METMIIGDGETFDWSNVIAKPDLLECKDSTKESKPIFLNINSLADEDAEWPVIYNINLVLFGFSVSLFEG